MHSIQLLIHILADVLAIVILFYIFFTISRADTKYVKDHILRDFEVMKRDNIFRNALIILAFSLIFSTMGLLLTFFHSVDVTLIDTTQIISNAIRIVFFLYLLKVVRVTMH